MFYAPLRHSTYRTIWIVLFFSNLGTWVQTLTSSILIAKLSDSPAIISLVQAAAMMPIFIFSLPAGIIADAIDRRSVILRAQVFMAVLALMMALVTAAGLMSPLLLIVMTFLLNAGLAFNQPAWQAVSSMLVPPADVKQAVVLNNLSYNLSRCVGPALAGLLFVALGPSKLYLLNALSFLGVIWAFYTKVGATPVEAPKVSFVESCRNSFNFFKEYSSLMPTFKKAFCYFFLASSIWALLPYLILHEKNSDEKALGLITMASGIGAIFNAYGMYKLRKNMRDSTLATLSFLMVAFFFLLINFSSSVYAIGFLFFVFGISWSISVSVYNGYLQTEFPAAIRSRLIGIYSIFFAGSQALGGYLSGLLVQSCGMSYALLIISALSLGAFFIYFFKSRKTSEARVQDTL